MASSSCGKWEIAEDPRIIKWLSRHRNYFPLYQRMKNEILQNPYSFKRLRGKCSRYRRHKRGDLRVVFEIQGCIVVMKRVGLRKNIYKELGCE